MRKAFILSILAASVFFFGQFLIGQDNISIKNLLSPVVESSQPKIIYPTWDPETSEVKGASTANINLTATAALSYDTSTDTLIYAKNIDKKLPMASLTKIMTALLSLEEGKDKLYRVSERAASTGENSMGLSKGEVLTLEELLYGLLLPSGNDAAEVIAEGSRYGRDGFVVEMNKRAKELGLNNTNFTNPSGLEGDGNQYTTTIDLLKLTKIAMSHPTFYKIVSTYEHELPKTKDHKYYHLFNDTNLLTSYPGVKGVKTGFTYEAGMCLVSYLEHNGRVIIAVIMNSENRRQEMKDLLDYSLIQLNETPPPHQ